MYDILSVHFLSGNAALLQLTKSWPTVRSCEADEATLPVSVLMNLVVVVLQLRHLLEARSFKAAVIQCGIHYFHKQKWLQCKVV